MDLDFLSKQLNELLEGREVEIPRFDFKEGKRYFCGRNDAEAETPVLWPPHAKS